MLALAFIAIGVLTAAVLRFIKIIGLIYGNYLLSFANAIRTQKKLGLVTSQNPNMKLISG